MTELNEDDGKHFKLRDGISRLGLRGSGERLISRTGGSQDWLIDLRRVFLDKQLLEYVTFEFWRRFGSQAAFQAGGMETAAIPLLTAIYMNSPEQREIKFLAQ